MAMTTSGAWGGERTELDQPGMRRPAVHLGFPGDLMAARTAWVGGIVIFVMALASLVQFAEWEEWIALIAGALVIISPWALGFAAKHTVCRMRGAWNHRGLVVDLGALGNPRLPNDGKMKE